MPEDCTEVVYNGGVYIYKLSSAPTSETMVNFINEMLIPEVEACSDTGECLVRDPSGNDILGLERMLLHSVHLILSATGYRTAAPSTHIES